MITVVVPICLLIVILLWNKLPLIGGNIKAALAITALAAMLMRGVFNPLDWIGAWIDGIDRLAWIVFLTTCGSIYAETQIKLGTMDTVFGVFQAKFSKRPRAMCVCIIIVCVLAGAILGGGTPAAAIVGVLTVPTLRRLGMDGEHIAATLVMGCAAGSIMPPVSQAIFLSASLLSVDVDVINNIAYFTVLGAVIIACLYITRFFVKKDANIIDYDEDGNEITPESTTSILKRQWYTLIPLAILVVIIILRTAKVIDLLPDMLNLITIGGEPLLTVVGRITFIKGITNATVLILIFATLIAFLFPKVHKEAKDVVVGGIKNVGNAVVIQLFSAFMVGAFYKAGQIDVVTEFASGLNINVLIIGGGICMLIMGMLTGTQSTPQNAIFTFWGPSLVNTGIPVARVGVAGSHLAAAGQGLPPADLTTFAIVGLVSGITKEKIDPLKTMFLSAPMWGYVTIVSFVVLYL